jgi:hypothetical protein
MDGYDKILHNKETSDGHDKRLHNKKHPIEMDRYDKKYYIRNIQLGWMDGWMGLG